MHDYNQCMFKDLRDGRIYDETRGLLITIDPTKPHPQNRQQQYLRDVKISTLVTLDDDVLDYLLKQTRNLPDIPDRDWIKFKSRELTRQRYRDLWLDTMMDCDIHGDREAQRKWMYHARHNQWWIFYGQKKKVKTSKRKSCASRKKTR